MRPGAGGSWRAHALILAVLCLATGAWTLRRATEAPLGVDATRQRVQSGCVLLADGAPPRFAAGAESAACAGVVCRLAGWGRAAAALLRSHDLSTTHRCCLATTTRRRRRTRPPAARLARQRRLAPAVHLHLARPPRRPAGSGAGLAGGLADGWASRGSCPRPPQQLLVAALVAAALRAAARRWPAQTLGPLATVPARSGADLCALAQHAGVLQPVVRRGAGLVCAASRCLPLLAARVDHWLPPVEGSWPCQARPSPLSLQPRSTLLWPVPPGWRRRTAGRASRRPPPITQATPSGPPCACCTRRCERLRAAPPNPAASSHLCQSSTAARRCRLDPRAPRCIASRADGRHAGRLRRARGGRGRRRAAAAGPRRLPLPLVGGRPGPACGAPGGQRRGCGKPGMAGLGRAYNPRPPAVPTSGCASPVCSSSRALLVVAVSRGGAR